MRLPTWLWIGEATWTARAATAAVPGLSVTAVASPTRTTWSMGDGAMVICRGPGTPYPPTADPKSSSPTCGHVYTASSAGRPGDAFGVTATITWSITWRGGGAAGTLPALSTTARIALRVAESQAVLTRPDEPDGER